MDKIFSGDSINTEEDIQNIKETVMNLDSETVTIDKKVLLSLIEYIETLQTEVEISEEDKEIL
ncbi:hypothetical protein [Cytobacillus oceanisediminis]|uniref:Uncharacterized protein n=1 Tax=Cytobacillus oceanisediminis 2691 TaxID=1196031 RepID=A0A160MB90_9BACI|nr:hypothetical protein [Cytobacillus oceanisediminis]AND39558.1 hypothetical protein A361_10575 [Cytobacillus oceanisediminis 2691]